MEEITCLFCGKTIDYVAIAENGYFGRRCLDCDLIFISPRPDLGEIANLYTEDHAVQYADAQYQFQDINRLAAASTLSKILSFANRGLMLELGPGGGFFMVEAQKRGFQPYGIELNPIEAEWINKNLKIPCESVPLNEKSFGGLQFDVVYHKDVLSHLPHPVDTFKQIHRSLKKGGIMVFETGNIGELSPSYYKIFYQFNYPDHLFFFGEKSIRMLLERTGFKCLKVFREPILLHMLIHKMLWRFRASIKDEATAEKLKMQSGNQPKQPSMSLKRRVRKLYRYTSYFLLKCGKFLPKKGTPLKLVVVAVKE